MSQSLASGALGMPLLVGVITIVCTVPLHGMAGYSVVTSHSARCGAGLPVDASAGT